MTPRPWRQKIKLEKYKELVYQKQLPFREVAAYFKVTVSGLIDFRNRNNLPPRGWAKGVGPRTGSKMPIWLREKLKKINYGKWTRDKNPNWSGGKRTNTQGYIVIRNPDHPYADASGYVREHRLVMEKHLGRYLERREQVHHINGNRTDNKISNLVLCSSDGEHKRKFHLPEIMERLERTPSHIKHSLITKAS